MLNPKTLAVRQSSDLAGIARAVLFTLVLLALAGAASAAPCCESCAGFPDPPWNLDYCWTHCVTCGSGQGHECGGYLGLPCPAGQECINGYCSTLGFAPMPFESTLERLIAGLDAVDSHTVDSDTVDSDTAAPGTEAPPCPPVCRTDGHGAPETAGDEAVS